MNMVITLGMLMLAYVLLLLCPKETSRKYRDE